MRELRRVALLAAVAAWAVLAWSSTRAHGAIVWPTVKPQHTQIQNIYGVRSRCDFWVARHLLVMRCVPTPVSPRA